MWATEPAGDMPVSRANSQVSYSKFAKMRPAIVLVL